MKADRTSRTNKYLLRKFHVKNYLWENLFSNQKCYFRSKRYRSEANLI